MRAAWKPEPVAASMQRKATTVLPQATSPCGTRHDEPPIYAESMGPEAATEDSTSFSSRQEGGGYVLFPQSSSLDDANALPHEAI